MKTYLIKTYDEGELVSELLIECKNLAEAEAVAERDRVAMQGLEIKKGEGTFEVAEVELTSTATCFTGTRLSSR